MYNKFFSYFSNKKKKQTGIMRIIIGIGATVSELIQRVSKGNQFQYLILTGEALVCVCISDLP